VCCRVLQCVAVRCSVLKCDAKDSFRSLPHSPPTLSIRLSLSNPPTLASNSLYVGRTTLFLSFPPSHIHLQLPLSFSRKRELIWQGVVMCCHVLQCVAAFALFQIHLQLFLSPSLSFSRLLEANSVGGEYGSWSIWDGGEYGRKRKKKRGWERKRESRVRSLPHWPMWANRLRLAT